MRCSKSSLLRRRHSRGVSCAALTCLLAACQGPMVNAVASSPSAQVSESEGELKAQGLRWRMVKALDQCPVAMAADGVHVPVWYLLGSVADWSRYFASTPRDTTGEDMDWGRERVLLISLGARRTAGWSIEAVSSVGATAGAKTWSVDRGILSARVRSVPPAAGTMQSQVLSEPCLLAVVPALGWREARVQSAD